MLHAPTLCSLKSPYIEGVGHDSSGPYTATYKIYSAYLTLMDLDPYHITKCIWIL
jgi:hypothetical protein